MGGGYNLAGATLLTNGNFNITSNATTANATITGGTLAGNGAFTVTHQLDWNGGTMSGQGRTEIPVGAVLNMGGAGTFRTLAQRTLKEGRLNPLQRLD